MTHHDHGGQLPTSQVGEEGKRGAHGDARGRGVGVHAAGYLKPIA